MTTKHELYHYGIKGMKWGVRKDKENGGFPRRRASKSQNEYYDPDFNARTITVKGRKLRVVDMGTPASKLREKIQDWSEAEDGRIRDALNYGKITAKEAKRKWDDLAEETQRRLNEVKDRKIPTLMRHAVSATWAPYQQVIDMGRQAMDHANMHNMMQQQINMQTMQNLQMQSMMTNQMAIQAANQTASLGLTAGTNPFMFG